QTGARSRDFRTPGRSDRGAWPPTPLGVPGWWRHGRHRQVGAWGKGNGTRVASYGSRAASHRFSSSHQDPRPAPPLHTPHPQCHDVLYCHGLVGAEGLAIADSNQGAIVGILGLYQRIQVLAGGEGFASRLNAVELTRIAPNA